MERVVFSSIVTVFVLATSLNIILFGYYFESAGDGFEVWIEETYFEEVDNGNGIRISLNFTISNRFEYTLPYNYVLFFYNGSIEIDYYIGFVNIEAASMSIIEGEYYLTVPPSEIKLEVSNGIRHPLNLKVLI